MAVYQERGKAVSDCVTDAVSNPVKPIDTGHLLRLVMLQKAIHSSADLPSPPAKLSKLECFLIVCI